MTSTELIAALFVTIPASKLHGICSGCHWSGEDAYAPTYLH